MATPDEEAAIFPPLHGGADTFKTHKNLPLETLYFSFRRAAGDWFCRAARDWFCRAARGDARLQAALA
jgi:hypothetical protein